MTIPNRYRCKLCHRIALMEYNHVGNYCGALSSQDDCAGTFQHPTDSECANRGKSLPHDKVEAFR